MQKVDFFSPDLQLHSAFLILDSGLHLGPGILHRNCTFGKIDNFGGNTWIRLSNVGQNLDRSLTDGGSKYEYFGCKMAYLLWRPQKLSRAAALTGMCGDQHCYNN